VLKVESGLTANLVKLAKLANCPGSQSVVQRDCNYCCDQMWHEV